MKDIRLEVRARVYRILLEFVKNTGLRTFGIKSRYEFPTYLYPNEEERRPKHVITIYTNRPGLVIGKHGDTIEQLKHKIHEDELDKDIDIVLEELDFFIRDDNEPYSDEEQTDFMHDYMMARGF